MHRSSCPSLLLLIFRCFRITAAASPFRFRAYGIMGMRERVASYGGDLEISGTPGQGTVLVARIPDR